MTTHPSSYANAETIEGLRGFAAPRYERILKRALDMLLTVPLLILCSPMWLILVVWIRLTSDGPAIFRQERIGVRGQHFMLYKFRSMVVASEDVHRDYARRWIRDGESARTSAGEFKLTNDRRITPVGAFLRKYSLDELPQMLNVLQGDMSLVGPRPALPYEVENYRPRHLQRLYALPGITGLWQVSGRNRLSFEQMVSLDLQYIHSWSLHLDFAILIRTVTAVVRGSGH